MQQVGQSPQEIIIRTKYLNKNPISSFSRQARFSLQKPICQAYYTNVNYKIPKRRVHMGSGERAKLFEGTSINPSPGQYSQKSQFDPKVSIKKGFSFGTNREQMKFENYLKNAQKTPAPGQYDIQKNRYRSKAYSLRVRTKDPQNNFLPTEQVHSVPGPGEYKLRNGISDRYQIMQSRINQALKSRNKKAHLQRIQLKSRIKQLDSVNSVESKQVKQYGSVNLNAKNNNPNLEKFGLSNGPLMDKVSNLQLFNKKQHVFMRCSQYGFPKNTQRNDYESGTQNNNAKQNLKENFKARLSKNIRPITAIQ